MNIKDRISIEVASHVGIVTLNRPEKMNALDPDMFQAIAEAGSRNEERHFRKSSGFAR